MTFWLVRQRSAATRQVPNFLPQLVTQPPLPPPLTPMPVRLNLCTQDAQTDLCSVASIPLPCLCPRSPRSGPRTDPQRLHCCCPLGLRLSRTPPSPTRRRGVARCALTGSRDARTDGRHRRFRRRRLDDRTRALEHALWREQQCRTR